MREISRRYALKLIGGAGIGLLLNEACSGSRNSKSQSTESIRTGQPAPTESPVRTESQTPLSIINLDKYKYSEVPIFEIPNVVALSRPYVGIKQILFFANRTSSLLFSAISVDSDHTGHSDWGKDARAGFCLYDDSFDPNNVEVLGQVDPPKFNDPVDFELEAIAFLSRTIPDLKYKFLEYQRIPPAGKDLMYLIREGIMVDEKRQPNPRSLVEVKARFEYSDPIRKS